MIVRPLEVNGAFLITPERFRDERGFFARTWCSDEFASHGLDPTVTQCSVSFNRLKGTMRGMHFQHSPHGEVKLVRCTSGAVYDVIVDVRRSSPTFLGHVGVELSAENHEALYIPKGFAHGFVTLTDNAEVFYQMSNLYVPTAAGGFRFDDPAFAIDWPTPVIVINARDSEYQDFDESLAYHDEFDEKKS